MATLEQIISQIETTIQMCNSNWKDFVSADVIFSIYAIDGYRDKDVTMEQAIQVLENAIETNGASLKNKRRNLDDLVRSHKRLKDHIEGCRLNIKNGIFTEETWEKEKEEIERTILEEAKKLTKEELLALASGRFQSNGKLNYLTLPSDRVTSVLAAYQIADNPPDLIRKRIIDLGNRVKEFIFDPGKECNKYPESFLFYRGKSIKFELAYRLNGVCYYEPVGISLAFTVPAYHLK